MPPIKRKRVEEKWDSTNATSIENMFQELYDALQQTPETKVENGKFYVKISGAWKEVTTT